MKNKNIIKWTIVSVLFLLLGLSVLCLNRQVKSLFVELANDSINVVSQREDISKEINKLLELGKDFESKSFAVIKKNTKIDSIVKNSTCPSDTIKKLIAEKRELDSLVNVYSIAKDSIDQRITILRNEYSNILKTTQKDNAKTPFWSSLSITTIILIVIAFILVTAFIVSLILLFSGILKLFKKNKKMEEINNPTTNIDSTEPENLQSNDTIEFVSPKPVLTSKVYPANNSSDCVVEIQSSLDDTKIYYGFKDEMKPIEYTSPITINRKCLILAIGQCGNEKSEQIEIHVDPTPNRLTPPLYRKSEQIEIHVDPTQFIQNNLTDAEKQLSNNSGDANSEANQGEENSQSNGHDAIKDGTNEKLDKEDKKSSQTGTNKAVDPAIEKRVRKFTSNTNILGISFQGDNHIKANPIVPCQDCHSFTKVNDIWNIAIVSDGAGSKEHSDVGSDAVCAAFAFYLSHMLKTDKRFANGDIPNERIWDLEFRALLTKFQNELKTHKAFKSYEFGSLAATIVILAYSPKGYLFAHVGDGRAGVKVNGEWKGILTPHKGEEASQTIFSTTIEFINKPTLMMSGVFVPETKVEQCDIEAFVLISDGCEDGAWATYQKVNLPDGDFKVEDVNQPRPQTLEELMSILDDKEDNHKELIINFITGYNKGFKTEGDDKTILIGRIK